MRRHVTPLLLGALVATSCASGSSAPEPAPEPDMEVVEEVPATDERALPEVRYYVINDM